MAETRLRPVPPRARFVLHAEPAALPAIAAALGVAPPTTPLASAVAGGRAALWLGPGEWLLLAEPEASAALLLGPGVPGAWLVEVTDARLGYALEGPEAATALNEGCPLDLAAAAFPPGACTRTLFGKVEILLWRRGPAAFEVELARSLAAAFEAMMAEVLADLGPDPA